MCVCHVQADDGGCGVGEEGSGYEGEERGSRTDAGAAFTFAVTSVALLLSRSLIVMSYVCVCIRRA
jgi:hypothetical protein